ncbi:MAG: tRNA (adenosine(37)-N6)-threonylcarbamoyltransferase complex ATPase subunit type 1 TsaE [Gammaproteobacteria bacterium]|nr:tRNA (adenosine(37)-N6)-threonylcarbamoyltransferase complex ATPase subunit type 1 TsaE [Gammaproteobacteria bacterium]
MIKTIPLADEAETLQCGAKLAACVEPGTLIFLEGNLGAGKTTFCRGFLRGLGYQGKVKSPTYTLLEVYEVAGKEIIHCDFYRLTQVHELEFIGLQDYFQTAFAVLIEWAEKVDEALPNPDMICHLTIVNTSRVVNFEAKNLRGQAILKKLR